MPADPNTPVQLTAAERDATVQTQATCPFIASAVAQDLLSVRNDASAPLASIEDVRRLGNSGGGDLGEVLVLFASGNHGLMRGATGRLDQPAPAGLFSLEFPGSQGSHPGHSGILQGDPRQAGSGRLDRRAFDHLAALANDGWIRRSDVGRFIAQNVLADPNSTVLGRGTLELLADVAAPAQTIAKALAARLSGHAQAAAAAASQRDLEQRLTKLLGEDNLVGSAGEFGLLFAFLANRPGARKVDGEPAVSVDDLASMFIDKRLPEGWETWKKTRGDWLENTSALLIHAATEYRIRKPLA